MRVHTMENLQPKVCNFIFAHPNKCLGRDDFISLG